MRTKHLSVMTVKQFAQHLTCSLNYKRIWVNEFPTYDFCIIDVEQKEHYTEEELENLYLESEGWHGIKTFDPGFGGNSLFVASDYWGGGNCSMIELYDGIDVHEAFELLSRAIVQTLETNDTASVDTLLLIERRAKEDHHPVWMRLGVTLYTNEIEETVLLDRTCPSHKYAANTIKTIISEGRYEINGDSYIPNCAVSDFNEAHGTDYDASSDLEWDI